jgi:hypothetical protein
VTSSIETPECEIAAQVMRDIGARAADGMAEYGQTMMQNPMDAVAWLRELRTELQDAALYNRRAEIAIEKLVAENACLRQQLLGPFVPNGRRTSHLEDLRVVNENGDEVINWSVAWSVEDSTGRPTEVFIHNTGKPGSLQDGLDQLGRMISKIIQGRWDEKSDC